MLSPSGPPGRTGLDRDITNIWVKWVFPKMAPSVGGAPKFCFLTNMAIIKHQKSALGPEARDTKISAIRKYKVGDMEKKMGTENGHISGPMSPKGPSYTMRITMSPRARYTQRAPKK